MLILKAMNCFKQEWFRYSILMSPFISTQVLSAVRLQFKTSHQVKQLHSTFSWNTQKSAQDWSFLIDVVVLNLELSQNFRIIQILHLRVLTVRELYVFTIKIEPNLFDPHACGGQTVWVVSWYWSFSQPWNLGGKNNMCLQLLMVKLPIMFFFVENSLVSNLN